MQVREERQVAVCISEVALVCVQDPRKCYGRLEGQMEGVLGLHSPRCAAVQCAVQAGMAKMLEAVGGKGELVCVCVCGKVWQVGREKNFHRELEGTITHDH